MSTVLQELRGEVFWITLNRPEKHNALNSEVLAGIAAGFRAAHASSATRAIVLTGAGDKAFCAGADLQPGAAFVFDTSEPSSEYANLLRLAKASQLPSIARVNGACLAGGMGLLCMTDLAIAADHAQFGLPETRLGLFPFQVLSLLKSVIGPRVLRECALTGKPLNAEEARTAGLLNYVVPATQLDEKLEDILTSLIANSPSAIRRGRYALNAIESMSFEQALAFTEGQLALMALTEDAREGLAAFNEKRRPIWTGK